MDIKQKFALELAKEISHYRLYEVGEIVKVIMPYFKMMHKEILQEGINDYEKEYADLLQQQTSAANTKAYFELGLKIAANKTKRTELRFALNNEKRDDALAKCKIKLAQINKERDLLADFIKENNGSSFQDIIIPKLQLIQSQSSPLKPEN